MGSWNQCLQAQGQAECWEVQGHTMFSETKEEVLGGASPESVKGIVFICITVL